MVVAEKGEELNNVVKLDLDTKSLKSLLSTTTLIRQIYEYIDRIEIYETRKGFHYYIYLNKRLPNWAILCIEVLLNTDKFKMFIDLRRLIRGFPCWNVLFKAKYRKKGNKVYWSREERTVRCIVLKKALIDRLDFLDKLIFRFPFLNKIFKRYDHGKDLPM